MKYYCTVPRAQRRTAMEIPPEAHGTNFGYYKHACLCDRCRAWARDYRRSVYNPRAERARTARRAAERQNA